jgi:hypothetical protein
VAAFSKSDSPGIRYHHISNQENTMPKLTDAHRVFADEWLNYWQMDQQQFHVTAQQPKCSTDRNLLSQDTKNRTCNAAIGIPFQPNSPPITANRLAQISTGVTGIATVTLIAITSHSFGEDDLP